MWNGSLVPRLSKASEPEGEHSNNPQIDIGETRNDGMTEILIQFNHVCEWPGHLPVTPPSNAITYTYLMDLATYDPVNEFNARKKLQEELDYRHRNDDSMRWIIDNQKSGRLETLLPSTSPSFWS